MPCTGIAPDTATKWATTHTHASTSGQRCCVDGRGRASTASTARESPQFAQYRRRLTLSTARGVRNGAVASRVEPCIANPCCHCTRKRAATDSSAALLCHTHVGTAIAVAFAGRALSPYTHTRQLPVNRACQSPFAFASSMYVRSASGTLEDHAGWGKRSERSVTLCACEFRRWRMAGDSESNEQRRARRMGRAARTSFRTLPAHPCRWSPTRCEQAAVTSAKTRGHWRHTLFMSRRADRAPTFGTYHSTCPARSSRS